MQTVFPRPLFPLLRPGLEASVVCELVLACVYLLILT